MLRLGVNIDHVATIRQARGTSYPNILEAAKLACLGGADQITVHLREDRRHIQDADVYELKSALKKIPLNLEMAAVDEIVKIALNLKPQICTLVPEKRQEQTTESGLNLIKDFNLLQSALKTIQAAKIQVSLFIEPNLEDVRAAKELKAEIVEFHTGPYALAIDAALKKKELEKIKKAACLAKQARLKVAAGHGLHYENTTELIQTVPEIEELNIGHAIVARAVFIGLEGAVREMKELL
ncbi:MAG: pyridoxine 5'-phosphate synthase [Pseudomonadota bacterium]